MVGVRIYMNKHAVCLPFVLGDIKLCLKYFHSAQVVFLYVCVFHWWQSRSLSSLAFL